MDDYAIKISSLGIRFFLRQVDGGWRRREEFWALKDINLKIKKGEVFGIIGANGSGKSTLLKIIAGIYPSTVGTVEVRGRVAPLIELGASFNPELTGAENIYLAGSIYRIPRKVIRREFPRIVEFSGLQRFIHTPVKNYSSGMFIRLAFSVVIFFEPDIVLVDEIFAVGDRVFQQKSFEKILSFRDKGASLVIVSHDMNLILQLCHRVAVLSRGRISFLGSPEEAVNHYLQLIKKREGLEEGTASEALGAAMAGEVHTQRWGNRLIEITEVVFVDETGRPKDCFNTGDYFEARISYVNHGVKVKPVFGVAIYTIYRMLLYGPNTLDEQLHRDEIKRENGLEIGNQDSDHEKIICRQMGSKTEDSKKLPEKGVGRFIIDRLPLLEGDYLFSASVYDSSLTTAYDHHEMMYSFRVKTRGGSDFGLVRIESRWIFEEK